MKQFFPSLLFLFTLLSLTLSAQNAPIINTTVSIKGTTNGASTNQNGEFTLLTGQKLPFVVLVSYVGYQTREFTLTENQAEIRLEEAASQLSDVTITSRCRQESSQEVPIPISVVRGPLIEDAGAFNVNRLKELIPSVQLYSSNARNTTFNIRGLGCSFGLTNDSIDPGVAYWLVKSPPAIRATNRAGLLAPGWELLGLSAPDSILWKLAVFFTEAGAFVFGSGLAIVPFLYGGVVKEYGWLTEQQFLDAVAVAMITPGPVVITVAFIGFLVAGLPGAVVAAGATFLPCYLFTILPAPYFRKYGRRPGIKAFVDGITMAAVGAIAGAVVVLARRQLGDMPAALIAFVTAGVLYRFPKLSELYLIGGAALLGLILRLATG